MNLKRKMNLNLKTWYLGYLHLTEGSQAAMGCITGRQMPAKPAGVTRYGRRGVSGWQEGARVHCILESDDRQNQILVTHNDRM